MDSVEVSRWQRDGFEVCVSPARSSLKCLASLALKNSPLHDEKSFSNESLMTPYEE